VHIVIAGGRGLLGSALTLDLRAHGHLVSVLTRDPRRAGEVAWASRGWRAVVESADAVVNLAGEPIAGRRWTRARKAAIRASRIQTTRDLAQAIRDAPSPPRVFLSGSAVGIYGDRGGEPLTEAAAPGSDFLAAVCRAWEHEAAAVAGLTRVVLLRTGIVLSRDGGALPQMALPFHFFAGGPLGSGRQYISWIHLRDWVAMTHWALGTPAVAGALNVTAPNPATNREFARALGRVLRRPALIPGPALGLRLALGEMSAALLTGQRVLPAKAQDLGFSFQFPDLQPALGALYR
jgi:uncharacterized protein (TIGR01777 family)